MTKQAEGEQGSRKGGAKPQKDPIGGWLSVEEGVEFEAYANTLGIDLAALATILVVRELNCDNLSKFDSARPRSRVSKGKRISAHTNLTDLKERFGRHALRHGLRPDPAAAILFRAELSERWLWTCLGFNGNQLDSHA